MSESEQDEPKLIIDEDWKESVQREKEQAAAKQREAAQQQGAEPAAGEPAGKASGSSQTEPAAAAADSDAAGKPRPAAGGAGPDSLPPASFDLLVTTLATQAMMALGQLPGPEGKLGEVEKPIAKHYIDMLGVLEDKCRGNLDAQEQRLLSEVLHNLRMAFVAVK